MEVEAGLGAFTVDCNPSLTFDGITIPVNENGLAVYKFKAPDKAGKIFQWLLFLVQTNELNPSLILTFIRLLSLLQFSPQLPAHRLRLWRIP